MRDGGARTARRLAGLAMLRASLALINTAAAVTNVKVKPRGRWSIINLGLGPGTMVPETR